MSLTAAVALLGQPFGRPLPACARNSGVNPLAAVFFGERATAALYASVGGCFGWTLARQSQARLINPANANLAGSNAHQQPALLQPLDHVANRCLVDEAERFRDRAIA